MERTYFLLLLGIALPIAAMEMKTKCDAEKDEIAEQQVINPTKEEFDNFISNYQFERDVENQIKKAFKYIPEEDCTVIMQSVQIQDQNDESVSSEQQTKLFSLIMEQQTKTLEKQFEYATNGAYMNISRKEIKALQKEAQRNGAEVRFLRRSGAGQSKCARWIPWFKIYAICTGGFGGVLFFLLAVNSKVF